MTSLHQNGPDQVRSGLTLSAALPAEPPESDIQHAQFGADETRIRQPKMHVRPTKLWGIQCFTVLSSQSLSPLHP